MPSREPSSQPVSPRRILLGKQGVIPSQRSGHHKAGVRLLGYLAGVWALFLVSLLLLFLISSLTAAKAWIIQPVVDAFRQGRTTEADLLLLCGAIFAFFALQAGFTFLYSLVSRTAGARIVRSLREDLFAHVLRNGLSSSGGRHTSDLASRVVNDVVAFEAASVDSLQGLVRDIFTLVLLCGVMFYHGRSLALVCLAVIAVVGVLLTLANRSIRMLSRRVQERISGITRELQEILGGVEAALAFGLAPRWRDRFREANSEHYGTVIRLQRTSFAAIALVQTVMGLGLAAVFWITGRSLLRGEVTEGQFLSVLGTMYLMQNPAVGIGQKLMQLLRGLAAGGRALEVLDEEPLVEEPEHPRSLPSSALGLAFVGVSFSYGDRPVLHDVSFTVEPFEFVALLGESGIGKTTVARLLLRFRLPQQGTVLLGGVPVAEVARRDLCRAVGYVAQEVFLLDETIRGNLTLGKPDASEREIAEVLRLACLDKLIAELPDGLETLTGERGFRLSGGQRQRLAIARALLMDPPVLVLDEATGALDPALEQQLLQNLVSTARRRTLFAITHRPGVAALADRCFLLRDGRMIESASTPASHLHQSIRLT